MVRLLSGFVVIFLLQVLSAQAEDSSQPLDVKWGQLVPVEAQADALKARGFLAGAQPPPDPTAQSLPPSIPEGDWLSRRMEQPGRGKPPAVVQELDGKRVRIGGYVVPLDFETDKVYQFLLVPYVGACIHVPPPPSNQIIYVETAEGFQISGLFDPVYVTGTIRTTRQNTGLAETGYLIPDASVALRKE